MSAILGSFVPFVGVLSISFAVWAIGKLLRGITANERARRRERL